MKPKVKITLFPTNDANALVYENCEVGNSLTPELEFYGQRVGNYTGSKRQRIVTTLPYIIEAQPNIDEIDPYHDEGNATNHRLSQCGAHCKE